MGEIAIQRQIRMQPFKDMTIFCFDNFIAVFRNFIRALAPADGFISIS